MVDGLWEFLRRFYFNFIEKPFENTLHFKVEKFNVISDKLLVKHVEITLNEINGKDVVSIIVNGVPIFFFGFCFVGAFIKN
jgi:hypothetical protein